MEAMDKEIFNDHKTKNLTIPYLSRHSYTVSPSACWPWRDSYHLHNSYTIQSLTFVQPLFPKWKEAR